MSKNYCYCYNRRKNSVIVIINKNFLEVTVAIITMRIILQSCLALFIYGTVDRCTAAVFDSSQHVLLLIRYIINTRKTSFINGKK